MLIRVCILLLCCSCTCLHEDYYPGEICEKDCEQDLDIIQRGVCPDGVGVRYLAFEKVDPEALIQICKEAQ